LSPAKGGRCEGIVQGTRSARARLEAGAADVVLDDNAVDHGFHDPALVGVEASHRLELEPEVVVRPALAVVEEQDVVL
jgi:hypothetical protein